MRIVRLTRPWLVLLIMMAVAAAAGAGWALREAMQPKVYFISNISFKRMVRGGVSKKLIARLDPVEGQYFTREDDLMSALRDLVGDGAFQRHERVMRKSLRSKNCWANSSPRALHTPSPSTEHRLYAALESVPVAPATALPPIPTQAAFLPDSEGLLVLGKLGDVVHLGPDFIPRARFRLPGVYQGDGDQGALGLVLDPEFAQNRFVYVSFVSESEAENVVQRFRWSGGVSESLDSRVDILRTAKDAKNDYHGVGNLAFDDQGMLLVPIGDPTSHAQRGWRLQGRLLGIIPGRGAEGGHSSPDIGLWDTLWGYATGSVPIALANGLRAPWSITPWRNLVIIGDVGASSTHSTEEINVYSQRGQNFGWGACRDPLMHREFVPPTIYYRRNDAAVSADDPQAVRTRSRSVLVGPVYDLHGAADRYDGALRNRLLYTDFYLGFVRGAELDQEGNVKDDVFLTHLPFVTDFIVAPDGFVYAVIGFGEHGMMRLQLRKNSNS